MVSGVAFDGLASGLETQEILEKLMEIEREPMRRLEGQREEKEAEKGAWEDINAGLSSFDSSLSPLRDDSTFRSRSVSSSNEDLVSARADTDAVEGHYEIEVQEIATNHRIASNRMGSSDEELGIEAELQINGEFVQIEEGDDLIDIRDAVNAADAGVRASVVDHHLVLTSQDTGLENFIDLQIEEANDQLDELGLLDSASAGVADAGDEYGALTATEEGEDYQVVAPEGGAQLNGDIYNFALQNADGEFTAVSVDGTSYHALEEAVDDLTEGELYGEAIEFSGAVRSGTVTAQLEDDDSITLTGDTPKRELSAPQDAQFTIDGLDITSDTNTGISDVMDGVTFDLHGVTDGPETVEIAHDTDRALEEVRGFVDKFNEISEKMDAMGARDEILAGDGTLRRISSSLRDVIMREAEFSDDHQLNFLHEVGISIDRHGEMSLDEDEFTDALRENPEDVRVLFAGRESQQGADGLSRRLGDHLHTYLRSGDGILTQREQMYDRMIESVDGRMETLERRLERREASLTNQFIQMEQALSDMQSQGQWLSGQIQSLPGMGGN